jgi:hypothetical protein
MRSKLINLLLASALFSCHCGERRYEYRDVTLDGVRLQDMSRWEFETDQSIIDFNEFVLIADSNTPGFKDEGDCSYDNITDDDVADVDVIVLNTYNNEVDALESMKPILKWRYNHADPPEFKDPPIIFYPDTEIFIRPQLPPAGDGNYKFAIVVTLSSGRILTDTTEQFIRVSQ